MSDGDIVPILLIERTVANIEMEVDMAKILDPVCDMIVDVEEQRGRGLTSEHGGKTYAFCGPGCKRAFDRDSAKYVGKVAAWDSGGTSPGHGAGHGGHKGS